MQPLAGEWTLERSATTSRARPVPAPPVRELSRLPALGVRVRGARPRAAPGGSSLAEALGREPQPVTFVVSLRLGEPPTIEPVRKRLDRYPTLRFKLDPTSEWTDELIAELVATGAVDSVDFKGLYKGTVVDQPPDPELYGAWSEAFPDAWIEDPELTRGDAARPRAAPRPHHLGRADPLDRRHRGAAVPAADGERQALALRRAARAVRRLRLARRARHRRVRRRPVRARARAAARSSTSPRSSTRTRRTTWRRPASTSPTRRRACPRARWPQIGETGFRWGITTT